MQRKSVTTTNIFYSKSSKKYNLSESLMQSFLPRALDRRLQEDWARDATEGPRVLISLRVDFGPMG